MAKTKRARKPWSPAPLRTVLGLPADCDLDDLGRKVLGAGADARHREAWRRIRGLIKESDVRPPGKGAR